MFSAQGSDVQKALVETVPAAERPRELSLSVEIEEFGRNRRAVLDRWVSRKLSDQTRDRPARKHAVPDCDDVIRCCVTSGRGKLFEIGQQCLKPGNDHGGWGSEPSVVH